MECPELAQISFRCYHKASSDPSAELVACVSYKLSDLRQGFRMVQLHDIFGGKDARYAFATLFTHLSIREKESVAYDI